MNFKFRHTEKIAGLFVFLAIAILIAGIIMIAVSRKMFVETFPFRTVLSDAAGLSSSTSLNFKGYEIGKVKNFFLNDRNNIDVELAIYEEYLSLIVPGSAIYRQTNPISGATSLVFLLPLPEGDEPVTSDDPDSAFRLLPESYIPSLDMKEGQKLMEENVIERSGDSVSIIFDEAKIFFSNLRSEFKLKKDSFRDFFKMLGDFSESLAKNREIFDYLNQLLNPKTGPVFATMEKFSEVSNRLATSVSKLEEMLENYKNPDGLMLKMFQVDKNRMDQSIDNLNHNLVTLQKMLQSMSDQSPLIADVLDKTRKTLEALNNNPFLRRGISQEGKAGNTSHKKRLDLDDENEKK
jgi:phospholipid/cholesterol/gamma-HCH transport system substrate-binding protein